MSRRYIAFLMAASDTVQMAASDTVQMAASDTVQMAASDTVQMAANDTMQMAANDTMQLIVLTFYQQRKAQQPENCWFTQYSDLNDVLCRL